ncbi:hypothetical protein PoB_004462200 [Plakobranchus ocellatus]|uniref:Uncharacterized protein n=1 Tax=Plakobranchus ocellatus TaxID=259542 RepID=A0AAV4BFT0_9GAST|nr:hypothetical protein PoB_004462200 [Plakobranchus ocellatus]
MLFIPLSGCGYVCLKLAAIPADCRWDLPAGGSSVGPTNLHRKISMGPTPNTEVASHKKVIPGFSSPPSDQGAGGGARARDRRIPADLRADSLTTVPPTTHHNDCETVLHAAQGNRSVGEKRKNK